MTILLTALIGLLGGLASGLFGVGGGTIFVPLLVMLRDWNAHLAIGTSLAVIVPTAIAGIMKYQSAGMIDWKTVLILSCFTILGAWFGAQLSLKLDALLLKRLFAIFLVGVALKLFFSNT